MQNCSHMVSEIESEMRLTQIYTGRSGLSETVKAALFAVPRHEFVPEDLLDAAYDNKPLTIGFGQTISQPYIVALMTELLQLTSDSVVLEVGTGCGYQTAVVAEIARQVYTIEIVDELSLQAQTRLQTLGYNNIIAKIGDGRQGWPEHAPFEAIIVTAAGPEVPPALIAQLKSGGRLVVPVGEPFHSQQLLLIEKDAEGMLSEREILPVSFVPLTGKH
ncbi:MAG: protein-L-isoaspartate(D-aspartate) O-methyltransferase [Gammaproteobacteria bacterium]|nr:MAG: protein-L-isoaspartate(D-aspartate) O-methyltransferase [Gammaproteobacteria bacterium]